MLRLKIAHRRYTRLRTRATGGILWLVLSPLVGASVPASSASESAAWLLVGFLLVLCLALGGRQWWLRGRLQRAEREADRFLSIFRYADIGMAFADQEGTVIIANPTFDAMLGYSSGETAGLNFQQFTKQEDTQNELQLLEELLMRKRDYYRLEKRYVCKDGAELWVDATITVVRDAAGNPVNFVGMIIDISARRQAQEELSRLAVLDHMTRIANRMRFDQRLEEEWRRHLRASDSLGVVMIDVDEFKAYNDEFGHQAGDEILKQVAETLSGVVNRASDMVARYGGEEFVMLLPGTDAQGARQVAEEVRRKVEQRAWANPSAQRHDAVTISAGCATGIPEKTVHSAEDLVQQADQALYQAKNNGRNRVESAAMFASPTVKSGPAN